MHKSASWTRPSLCSNSSQPRPRGVCLRCLSIGTPRDRVRARIKRLEEAGGVDRPPPKIKNMQDIELHPFRFIDPSLASLEKKKESRSLASLEKKTESRTLSQLLPLIKPSEYVAIHYWGRRKVVEANVKKFYYTIENLFKARPLQRSTEGHEHYYQRLAEGDRQLWHRSEGDRDYYQRLSEGESHYFRRTHANTMIRIKTDVSRGIMRSISVTRTHHLKQDPGSNSTSFRTWSHMRHPSGSRGL